MSDNARAIHQNKPIVRCLKKGNIQPLCANWVDQKNSQKVKGSDDSKLYFLQRKITVFHPVHWFSKCVHLCVYLERLFLSDTGCWPSVGVMLGQRRRRWPNINPTLCEYLEFCGLKLSCTKRRPCDNNMGVFTQCIYLTNTALRGTRHVYAPNDTSRNN